MFFKSISTHLRPYLMLARRRTTINHAFAAAIASADRYDEVQIREALEVLGFDPDGPLTCVYCGALAETWDHIFATVKDSRFSGYGHRLGNLLPCCKLCNSRKGNKAWDAFLMSLELETSERARRKAAIDRYIDKYTVYDEIPLDSPDIQKLEELRRQVLSILDQADEVAARIRAT